MSSFIGVESLFRRKEEDDTECGGDAVDIGHRGLRIASIFIILISSGLGALIPIILAHQRKFNIPKYTFFVFKFIGTGVIIATAWMHLLEPASDQLGDPCLEDRLGDYPWAFGIGLWTVMTMFFVEMITVKVADKGDGLSDVTTPATFDPAMGLISDNKDKGINSTGSIADHAHHHQHHDMERNGNGLTDDVVFPLDGEEHLAHRKEHAEGDSYGGNLAGQLLAIVILEFGVIFHSVFIGLTLGTTDEVVILLIVLTFHQLFEGLGLGSRLAVAPWPKDKGWLPYVLGAGFALSTPIGIAAGIGAQPKNANDQKLVNGVFDAISAGILMYTGLVELLAHEFIFNPQMRKAKLRVQLFAFACVLFGVFVMSLLAEWA